MEDVLTSSTIGLLNYLPDRLAAAVVAEFGGVRLLEEAVEAVLWPSYATPPGFRAPGGPEDNLDDGQAIRGRTEPDAVIRAAGWLIVLEAKYHSALDEGYDQLGREFVIGFNEAMQNRSRFRLLVVTAQTLEPKPASVSLVLGVQRAIERSQGDKGVEMIAAVPKCLRWTNWQRLYLILRRAAEDSDCAPHAGRLLIDTCKVLELHGLVPYDGASIQKAMMRWQSAGIPDGAWLSPRVYRSHTIASMREGWDEVIRSDISGLGRLAWHPYDILKRARPSAADRRTAAPEDFDPGLLQPLEWQPYQQKGNIR